MNRLNTVFLLVVLTLCQTANGQLRIVNYNVAGLNNSSATSTVLTAIKDEVVNGVAKLIDVLVLNEVDSLDITALLGILNAHGAGTYLAGNLGSTTGGGSVGIIYRDATVDLVAQQQVVNTSITGAARGVMRYTMRPNGYEASADFYIYGSHYKAGDTTSDANRRAVEATAIRSNANELGEGAHAIFTGDFNIYRSTEPMWAALTGEQMGAANNGRSFDPINQIGTWHDGASFKGVHTQNPAGAGGVGGGMDDRFDWQLITGELQDNEGMSIIPNSYHAFANNNTHTMNGHINTGTGASTTVLNALGNASDHLPVVAQYQVPALMEVDFFEYSERPRILKDAVVPHFVSVENVAGDGALVVNASGADELDYTIVTAGNLTGSKTGTRAAFSGPEITFLELDTSTTGYNHGIAIVENHSPQGSPAHIIHEVEFDVVDHANPSFDPVLDQNSLLLDFGTVAQNSVIDLPFFVSNLVNTFDYTAALEYETTDLDGDFEAFFFDDNTLWGDLIEAGDSRTASIVLNTESPGIFNATFTLMFSNEDLAGPDYEYELSLNLQATVTGVGLAGDFDNDGDVDGRDFLVWQRNPGVGNLGDWQNNYGTGSLTATSVAVPEPSIFLTFSAAITLLTVRKGGFV
jgi:exonuclease III